MIEIFKSFIFILFAWVIFHWIIPYGMYLTLKHKNMEKESIMRHDVYLKNRDCLNKDK